MLNRCIVQGRLTADPILRHTQTGNAVASFTLAVDRDFKDKATGEKATDFIDVVAWRNTAEFLARYAQKGSLIIADGRLQVRDWTDNNGNKRRSVEVIADNVYFGDRKREVDQSCAQQAENIAQDSEQFAEIDSDGQLPF